MLTPLETLTVSMEQVATYWYPEPMAMLL
jgi:hypothetical protein